MTDWRECLVVRDRENTLWGRDPWTTDDPHQRRWIAVGSAGLGADGCYEDEIERRHGPLTPVLDADGLPVVTTVGDLTALDALPVGSVVMEGSSGAPVPGLLGIPVMPGVFHRFPDGWHVVSGHGVGTPEFDLGPVTVLHAPCEVLP